MRRFLSLVCLLLLLLMSLPAPAGAAPESMRFAFVREGNLWLWADGGERQLTTGAAVLNPRFSHDGRFIAYGQEDAVKVIGVDGSGPWVLPASPPSFAWSPTADTLAAVTADQVITVAVTPAGLGPVRVVAQGWGAPVWSPDGRRLAVGKVERSVGQMAGVAYNVIGIVPQEGGEVQVILREPFRPSRPACGAGALPASWSPDGGWLLLIRPGKTPSIAADCNELLLLPAQGGTPWKIAETPHPRAWAAWEPARPLLAFVDGPDRVVGHRKALKVASPASGDLVTLTPAGFSDRDPAWAPSGRILAFTRSRETTPANMYDPLPDQAVYQVDADRPQAKRVPGSQGGFSPFIGRDGSLYWFTGTRADRLTLWHGKAPLIRHIGPTKNYYGYWNVDAVFDHWEPLSLARKAAPYSTTAPVEISASVR